MAMTSPSASIDLESPPPGKRQKVDDDNKEDREGYIVLEGKYDYGESLFSDLDCVDDEEEGLYTLYVVYYDDGDKPHEKVSAYMKQIAETEGFDIDDSPDAFFGSIRPLDLQLHVEYCKYVMKCLDYAIAQNNANPVKPKLEFVTVKKANFSPCAGIIYYITFVAKHVTLGKNFTFQAKVLYGIGGCLKVLIFRPLYKSPGRYEMDQEGSVKHVEYWEGILELWCETDQGGLVKHLGVEYWEEIQELRQ
ncbi:hypothetical protein Tsubulata_049984, partial [Turnera subulata]